MSRSINCPLEVWDEEETQLSNIKKEISEKIEKNNRIINSAYKELKQDGFEEQDKWLIAGDVHSKVNACYKENKELGDIR